MNNVFVICKANSSIQFVYEFVLSKVRRRLVMILTHSEGHPDSRSYIADCRVCLICKMVNWIYGFIVSRVYVVSRV